MTEHRQGTFVVLVLTELRRACHSAPASATSKPTTAISATSSSRGGPSRASSSPTRSPSTTPWSRTKSLIRGRTGIPKSLFTPTARCEGFAELASMTVNKVYLPVHISPAFLLMHPYVTASSRPTHNTNHHDTLNMILCLRLLLENALCIR